MMSPSFECSARGLRSAALLRARIQGRSNPEAVATEYMQWIGPLTDPDQTRLLIEVVIEDIEHLTSAYPNGLTDAGL